MLHRGDRNKSQEINKDVAIEIQAMGMQARNPLMCPGCDYIGGQLVICYSTSGLLCLKQQIADFKISSKEDFEYLT